MWERWRRIGARQGGESEAARPEPEVHADVPAKSNETDASNGGGGASACSDRGAERTRRGEHLKHSRTSQGHRGARYGVPGRRSATAGWRAMEYVRAYVHTCVRTCVRTGGQLRALNGAAAGKGQFTGRWAEGRDLGAERVSPEIQLPNL